MREQLKADITEMINRKIDNSKIDDLKYFEIEIKVHEGNIALNFTTKVIRKPDRKRVY